MKALPCALLCTALATLALAALPVQAKPGREHEQCSGAADPRRCQERLHRESQCRGKEGAERRRCLHAATPAADCRKSRDPRRCQAMQQAQAACGDKFGPELKACIDAHQVAAPD